MAQIAIKGHETRGEEVIEILEMLGGKMRRGRFVGHEISCAYYINEDGYMGFKHYLLFDDTTIFTLEEFLEKFPYKAGDKVLINADINDVYTIKAMTWDTDLEQVVYCIEAIDGIEHNNYWFACEMERYLEQKEETMETITIDDFKTNTKEWLIDKLHGMIISDAIKTIGNIHDELHKPEYPKTFIEVLNFWHPDRQLEDDYQRCYKKDLIEKFQDLLYARDAYWKIAGEQMGLGKPWEPNWLNTEQDKFVLYTHNDVICLNRFVLGHNVLAFPTKEMRDAFYENFKDLIEECKEFL